MKNARSVNPLVSTKSLYAAFKAKDARFDGRFFVGISSTGIYCRPVCRARQPKAENCTYYASAAAAEQAGFRPCLLCRPELAPGTSVTDATARLAYQAARLLEANCACPQGLPEIARQLSCTDRHLRRVFKAAYEVSPVQYLQTCRLLLAKNLLTDSSLSVINIAMASGFGSLRRFNDAFKKQYQLSPTALRKKASEKKLPHDAITLALGYRPPYSWNELLTFLAARAITGVELVKEDAYYRVVHLKASAGSPVYGWLRVGNQPEKNMLAITLSETLLPVLPQALARIRNLFDLNCDPEAIDETLSGMNSSRPGLPIKGMRLPGSFDAFELAVRAVLGQQVTIKAAGTLAARLVQAFGKTVYTGIDGLSHVFPSPDCILALEGAIENHLGPLGITASRARSIHALAKACIEGHITLSPAADPEEEMQKLMAITGIGSWTANYIAMRAMAWPDALMETDADIRKVLAPYSPKKIVQEAEAWRPWRSYAMMNLWSAL